MEAFILETLDRKDHKRAVGICFIALKRKLENYSQEKLIEQQENLEFMRGMLQDGINRNRHLDFFLLFLSLVCRNQQSHFYYERISPADKFLHNLAAL